MKKLFILVLLLSMVKINAFGYSILPITIKSQKHFAETIGELTLAPTPSIKSFVINNVSTNNIIFLEAYYTFKKPDFIENTITDSDKLFIINILHSISSMQGIQYYSHTRKKLTTLFEKSYVIQYPSLQRLNDPIVRNLQQTYTFYILQKDNTLGEVAYHCMINHSTDFIVLKIENISAIKYKMMPIVEKHKFKFFLFVLDKGKDIAIYCVYSIDITTGRVLLMQNIKESLYNRSDAIIVWFYNKLMNNY